jgi:hypothetical protein
MDLPEHVKLHLELWQSLADHAGHVVLVIQKQRVWEMLELLSNDIDSHLRSKETLEGFFKKLHISLNDPLESGIFRWSNKGLNADLWIQIRKTPNESKVYCSDDGCETWGEVIPQSDACGLARYKPLQCALANYLLDDELFQEMSTPDMRAYERLWKALT